MQDMEPTKRSIRRIPLRNTKYKRPVREEQQDVSIHENGNGHDRPIRRSIPKRGPRWGRWIAIIVILIIVFVVVSYIFSGAVIEVEQRQQEVTINGDFIAAQDGTPSDVSFTVMTLEATASRILQATGEEDIEQKASGRIIIYNDYDENAQRLLKNTRFETPEGLIYRVPESITVPGQRTVNGEVVPGSIDATVYADAVGEQYNIGITEFTVPGFRGQPQYDHFYAQSKTPMTGGFSGIARTVTANERENIAKELHQELEVTLREQLQETLPENLITVSDAIFTSFESMPNENVDSSEVRIVERGTLRALAFEKADLSEFIALYTVSDYTDEPVMADFDTINFSLRLEDVEEETSRIWERNTVSVDIEGQTTITWTFNKEQFIQDLLGKSKNDIATVLTGYPGIESVDVSMRPFWKRSFPNTAERITIKQSVLEETPEDE